MVTISPVILSLKHGLIVSCQATSEDGIYGPSMMAAMAEAAQRGGAVGIRADDPVHVAAIRRAVSLPIIGIYKQHFAGLGIRITPTIEAARKIVDAGADIIALDATRRGAEEGRLPAVDLIRQVRETLHVPVMADVATFEEGMAAAQAGADIVATTLAGYTDYSPATDRPAFELLAQLARELQPLGIPLIAEGRIATPAEARHALDLGAYAVVVGSMITRPRWIVEQYVAKIRAPTNLPSMSVKPTIVVDIGGTKIAAALITDLPAVTLHREMPTEAHLGGESVIGRVVQIIESLLHATQPLQPVAIGISTAGEPDNSGRIAYATDNLPGWEGVDLASRLFARFQLPVMVRNDGDMTALAEAKYGAGRGYDSVFAITVGTGLGSGFVQDGQLRYGQRGAGPALGHIFVERNGRPCTCGRNGCLEPYVNGAALRYEYQRIHPQTGSIAAEQIFERARQGDLHAQQAIQIVAGWLGYGIATAINLFDPAIVVIGGGMAQMDDLLFAPVREAVRQHIYPAIDERPIVKAAFGSQAPLIGAAAYVHQIQSSVH